MLGRTEADLPAQMVAQGPLPAPLLVLVGAWPGLSSPPPVVAGDPQGPVGAGITLFFQP